MIISEEALHTIKIELHLQVSSFNLTIILQLPKYNTGLQGFVAEKLWVVSGVLFDVESESGIRISLSSQDFEIFEVMCSKNGVFRYI